MEDTERDAKAQDYKDFQVLQTIRSDGEGKTNFSRLRVGHELVTKNRNQVTIGQS